jgi:hypothetical protein
VTGTRKRYVLLRHEVPTGQPRASHWDLMLEVHPELPLLTWALDELPRDGQSVRGIALEAHRRLYLEFEGEISGDRGIVWRWDEGEYDLSTGTWTDFAACQDSSKPWPLEWELELHGHRLQGALTISRETPSDQFWRFSFLGNIAVR